MGEKKIGVVTHYFGKIGVAAILITDGDLHVGDTIRVKRTIGEKTEHPKNGAQGFCIYEVEVLNQEDKVVQKGQWNMLIRRRES